MILNFWGSHTTELDKRKLYRSLLMSTPRENSRKNLKKFSAYKFLKNLKIDHFGWGPNSVLGPKSNSHHDASIELSFF